MAATTAPEEQRMESPPTVVFVCLHGSAKSLIAAEHFTRLAVERGVAARATSAGVEPDPEIPPKVIDGLLQDGIDVRGRQPRPVAAGELARARRVISFGCELGPLVPLGIPVERWDDVPAVSENYGVARAAILARVEQLFGRI